VSGGDFDDDWLVIAQRAGLKRISLL
jgi:hypothetical protein